MHNTLPPPSQASTRRQPERRLEVIAPAALRQGLIETRVTRRVAWSMIGAFLLLVYGVPAWQLAAELLRRESPQVLELFRSAPVKDHLRAWEDDLARVSIVKNVVQPVLQEALSELGGFGNSQAVIGRGGWLYYRPGIDYLAGKGFLSESHGDARRRKAVKNLSAVPHTDPRAAILDFDAACRRFGARLVVMPIPDKAMLEPDGLSARLAVEEPLPPANNPDFARFAAELRAAGVDVFDPTPARVAPGEHRFLMQDTHWTPDWMQQVAGRLAEHLDELIEWPEPAAADWAVEEFAVARLGDLVDMLRLDAAQNAFKPQQVTVRRVIDRQTRAPWRASPQAAVLLLGDSFTNIFSFAEMGWGDSAGLAEHLSLALGRPVDRISRNDAGAVATRELLAAELAKGRNRLQGKQVIVWQFAARELAVGDWRPVALELGSPPAASFLVPAAGDRRVVSGTIREIARAPKPGTVPYRDHIVALHLVDLADEHGPIAGGEALAYMWSMRDNVWTAAATYRIDQRVRLQLRPWSDVADRLEAINRGELDDGEVNLQEPCWGEEIRDE